MEALDCGIKQVEEWERREERERERERERENAIGREATLGKEEQRAVNITGNSPLFDYLDLICKIVENHDIRQTLQNFLHTWWAVAVTRGSQGKQYDALSWIQHDTAH